MSSPTPHRTAPPGRAPAAAVSRSAISELARPVYIRRLRLGAAFVLLAYLILHFGNHALGLISLQAMEAGRHWFLLLWRSTPGTIALYGAIAVHGGLALWLLYHRPSLRMPLWELGQYVSGLALPALLAGHVTFTRINWWQYGSEDAYSRLLLGYTVLAPQNGFRQAGILVLAWAHACVGFHFWLRFRPWYSRAKLWLLIAALLLPLFALGGFVAAGREMIVQARTPGWVEAQRAANPPLPAAAAAGLARRADRFIEGYLVVLMAIFAARGVRSLWQRRRAVRVSYPSGQVAVVPIGSTILDASRQAGFPHAAVCGGRGRCSTCRVLVVDGFSALPPAGAAEKQVLASVRAAPDVRLACQARPTSDVSVLPLLPPSVSASDAASADSRQGQEQRVAVLFIDLRGFTRMAEKKLPYDTVFILNRYFEAVGRAITGAGGITNQFTGDGVMALFGIKDGPETGCRQALAAVRLIVQQVARLSSDLSHDLTQPMRVGMGLHVGPAVIGQMGWRETFYLTAVGDTVHVAARLEQATKDYDAELVISDDVAVCAGTDLSAFPSFELNVRNRADPVSVRVIHRVASLSAAASERQDLTEQTAASLPPVSHPR